MSIIAYTGLPGSGKSYDVVANQVLPALKAGRRVCTNIPLNVEDISKVVPYAAELLSEFPTERVQASPELIDEYAKPGVVLILDEVWRLWPAGQKANQVPEPFRKLLAEHRHMVGADGNSMQIVLVTQDLAQIGKFARDLVETTFHHTKLTHIGASGSYRIDVYNGPMSGPNPPKAARMREIFGRYDSTIFKLYKSHTMSQAEGGGANEAAVDGRNNLWKRPMIYVGLAFVVACIGFGVPMVRKAFNPEEKAESLRPKKVGEDPRQVKKSVRDLDSPLSGGQAQPARAVKASGWRVAGYMVDRSNQGKVAITNGRYSLVIDAARNCDFDVDFGPTCYFEGQPITLYSDQRYPSPANVPVAVPAVAEASPRPVETGAEAEP